MDALETIKAAQTATLVDEDGDEVALELAPALSDGEIEQLEAGAGVPLPDELRELLRHTGGIDGPLESIDFTGREMSFEQREIFPAGHPIAHDGFGNFWVLDLTPERTAQAPVFFACHDAPVILYQSPNLAHFLAETFRMYRPPHASLVDDVHEDRVFRVARENPGTLDHAAALAGDEPLRTFASELDERFLFVDLREPEIGMGFSWGRYGPRTEVRRHGYEPLFAYAPPEKQPGLLRRLLG